MLTTHPPKRFHPIPESPDLPARRRAPPYPVADGASDRASLMGVRRLPDFRSLAASREEGQAARRGRRGQSLGVAAAGDTAGPTGLRRPTPVPLPAPLRRLQRMGSTR
jgi:hypothetical protein